MKKIGLILMGIVILSAMTAWSAKASRSGGAPVVTWLPTGDNSACASEDRRPVCKEMCLRMPDGSEVQPGVFCCFPEGETLSVGYGACESRRLD